MDVPLVLYEPDGPVATLTLNRPEVRNALYRAIREEFDAAFQRGESAPDVRAIIVTGAGSAFSAGIDLKGATGGPVQGHTPSGWRARTQFNLQRSLRIWDCPKPVIAAVNGHAHGAGCDLALVCDFTLAADTATFAEPEVRHVSGPPTLIAPWVLGLKRVMSFLLLGETLTATEALAAGMLTSVHPAGELMDAARALARQLAMLPPHTVELTKAMIHQTYDRMGLRNSWQLGANAVDLIHLEVGREELEGRQCLIREKGLKGFLAERDRDFEGPRAQGRPAAGGAGEAPSG